MSAHNEQDTTYHNAATMPDSTLTQPHSSTSSSTQHVQDDSPHSLAPSEKDHQSEEHTPIEHVATQPQDANNDGSKQLKQSQSTTSQAETMATSRIFIIMFSLCLALFLAALDVTIITTALPTIAEVFKATAADYTWIGSAYLLANAASTPLWGKISDIWGRKPIILLANFVFMIGSLVCALAHSIGMLIGGRVIQGIGGGGLIILVNICISDLFSMRDRAKYYGIVGMTWAIASALGPVLGGLFTQKVSWRWCFYINLPLDGAALINLFVFLKIDTPKTPFVAGMKAIDWVGVVTIVGGVVAFLFGMESGGATHPWGSAFHPMPHHLRHRPHRPLLHQRMEVRQIPDRPAPHLQPMVQRRLPRRRLLPRFRLHRRILLPPHLLPSRPRRHPDPLRRLPLPPRPIPQLPLRRRRHLHQKDRHVPPRHLVRPRHDDTRLRPLHRPRPHRQLGQDHHLPDHRGRRRRAQFPESLNRSPIPRQTPRHGHRHRPLRLHPQHQH